MDNPCRLWSNLTKGMHMSHYVVAPFLLFCSCCPEVFICHGDMIPHLLKSLVADVKAKLFLTLGEPDP